MSTAVILSLTPAVPKRKSRLNISRMAKPWVQGKQRVTVKVIQKLSQLYTGRANWVRDQIITALTSTIFSPLCMQQYHLQASLHVCSVWYDACMQLVTHRSSWTQCPSHYWHSKYSKPPKTQALPAHLASTASTPASQTARAWPAEHRPCLPLVATAHCLATASPQVVLPGRHHP